MLPAANTDAVSRARSCTPLRCRAIAPAVVHALELPGDRLDGLGIGPELQVAHQGLAGQLDEDPLEGGGCGVCSVGCHAPTAKRAKRRITTFSPVVPESSARICSIVLPSYLSPLTWIWFRRTVSSIHLRSLPSAIFDRTFSGLSDACCSNTRSSACLSASGISSSET